MDQGNHPRASVRVGHATIVVRGMDPAPVVPVVEQALVAALDELGKRWPTEWLFVRRVEIDLRARTSGVGLDAGTIAGALGDALARRFERLRAAAVARGGDGVEGVITEDAAWFPTEGAARGALLRGLLEQRPLQWPSTAMRWAGTLDDVAGWSAVALGDALAHAIGHAHATTPIPEAVARAWLGRWTRGPANLDLAALPATVRSRIRAAAIAADPTDPARVRALAHLFAAWPPARDATVDLRTLDELTARTPSPSGPAWWSSRAGGLAAWAVLFAETGLERALWSGDERLGRAQRWAVARALEAAQVGDGDPILRLWAGERHDGPPLARWAFDQLPAEPLHAAALRAAHARNWLDGDLTLAPLAGGAALMAGDLCLDHLPTSTDDALAPMVRRFTARAGRAPTALNVVEHHADAAIDGFADLDPMALPDAWRAATRAAASVARRQLATTWRAELGELRGWAARVSPGATMTIELPRARTARLPIALAGFRLALAGSTVELTVT